MGTIITKIKELENEVSNLEKQKGEFQEYFAKKQKECEALETKRLDTIKAIDAAGKQLAKKKADIEARSAEMDRETQRLKELQRANEIEERKIADERKALQILRDQLSARELEVSEKERALIEKLKKIVNLGS